MYLLENSFKNLSKLLSDIHGFIYHGFEIASLNFSHQFLLLTNIVIYSLHWKVDLTAYVEEHEFCFDAVLDERVTNDEVFLFLLFLRL